MTTAKNLPDHVEKYGESSLFTEQTVPRKLLSDHHLKPGVWGRLCVSSGALEFVIPGTPEQMHTISENEHLVIEPEQVHFVRPLGAVEFKIEFYR